MIETRSTSSDKKVYEPYVEFKDLPDTSTPIDATNLNELQSLMREDIDSNRSIPSGGTTGQVLTKASDTPYEVEWADEKSQVVDNLDGNSTTIAPSQNAVNDAFNSIFEIVTSDNGIAIKYNNGIMICTGKYSGKSKLSAYFTQYMRSEENIKVNFPVPFISDPYVVLQPTYDTYSVANILNSVSPNNFGFTALKGKDITGVTTVSCHYVAIGKWKNSSESVSDIP